MKGKDKKLLLLANGFDSDDFCDCDVEEVDANRS